eukprot:GHRR01009084.1.p1 GENE.GHRR01009084.1~~GHRR01009084.1.p1  ORF type:complete len:268 (+),score=84.85 GHRR01009084.1:304-1107(+)
MLRRTQRLAFAGRNASCNVPRPLPAAQRPLRRISADASLKNAPSTPVQEKGELVKFPEQPAVYAVYDKDNQLQYIGLTRKINVSVCNHLRDVPESTSSVRYEVLPDASRDSLTGAWKAWMEEALAETGSIPPGNAPGETKWQNRTAARPKADIKLTAGKAINVPIETLIDQVVKGNKVVAFVKGTRSAPQCGFSYKMLTILNELKTDYEVVNVLDDFYNPGLREAIKQYSQWPTIPQLYINGEFIGGSDIVEQMQASRELQQVLAGK